MTTPRLRPLPAARLRAWTGARLRRRHLPLLLLFAVAALLSVFVRDFFRQTILLPGLELAFALYRTYRSVPQLVVWLVLVGVAVAVAARALWRVPDDTAVPTEAATQPGRVHQLHDWIVRRDAIGYCDWQLAKTLERLIVAETAQRLGVSAETAAAQLAAGTVPLDPVLQRHIALCATVPTYRAYVERYRPAVWRRSAPAFTFDPAAVLAALAADDNPSA